jgi:hypothetical protein
MNGPKDYDLDSLAAVRKDIESMCVIGVDGRRFRARVLDYLARRINEAAVPFDGEDKNAQNGGE